MSETPEATNENPEVKIEEGAQATTVTVSTETEGEQELLAGKFKTQDDLVKAYKELESKLGQQQPQQPAEPEGETNETPEGEPKETEAKAGDEGEDDAYAAYGEAVGNALKEAEVDPAQAQAEFAENGTLSDETFEKFEKAGFARPVVEAYLRGVSQQAEQVNTIGEAQIEQIKAVAGGNEGYADLQKWMAGNLSAEEVEAFNNEIGTGDFAKAMAAVQTMTGRYQQSVGTEGKLLAGKSPAAETGYQTEAEMLEDMAKPEYKTSQSFRDKVAKKIANSPNIMLTR